MQSDENLPEETPKTPRNIIIYFFQSNTGNDREDTKPQRSDVDWHFLNIEKHDHGEIARPDIICTINSKRTSCPKPLCFII